jgi:phosphatidylglycerophosphatase A
MSNAATLFGLGRLGFAPGTLGSLAALPISFLVMRFGGMYALLAASAAVAIVGIWVSDAYARESGDSDPKECIIDEVAGQMLACALAPMTWLGFLLAFLLFRLFDVSKIWPISAVERIGGGAGIVGDDMLAGLLAGIVVAAVAAAGFS